MAPCLRWRNLRIRNPVQKDTPRLGLVEPQQQAQEG